MAEQGIYNLKINEGFKRLISPLSPEELRQLEENLVRNGCREPLCVWNNTILDGHNRYEICTRLRIPFLIKQIFLRNSEEAIAWICANQLVRRNITDETRRYLIGKRYEMEKILGAHNAVRINQHKQNEFSPQMLVELDLDDTATSTSKRIGKEYHISHSTVDKYAIYTHALDTLSKTVPNLVLKILSGEVKISQENVIELSRLSQQDICRLSKHITDSDVEFVGYSDMRKVLPKKPEMSKILPLPLPSGSVKDMPVHDPDAEISSLTLTVPSWVSSIDRTRSMANLGGISGDARRKLEKELLALKETIDTMLAAIKEEI